eukprot:NODE_2980_length_848_cov_244.675914.p1 GENE.NODE_2980_length_848_cov_244.675914~~NODE_2980_length_848_cov_244.675914.p1  ORF type:complete len:167 (+),score=57.31 NODE_2980_length_848_cov_244.675914:3-503(+)
MGSAPALAAAIEAFEAKVRVERLTMLFLARRGAWLQDLRHSRGSYAAVAAAARELYEGVRTPPRSVVIVAALRRLLPVAARVPKPVWAMILEYVGDTYPTSDLLQVATQRYAAGAPQQQQDRAARRVAWCMAALDKYRRGGGSAGAEAQLRSTMALHATACADAQL